MKKNAKKFLSILLSALMLLSVLPAAFAADEPAYVNAYAGLGDYSAPALGEGGEGTGEAADIPAQFSLVENMPAARNQNPYGSCWAFGTLSAVESNIITQGFAGKDEIDLSELQLIYYMYHPTVDPLGNITPGEGSYRNDGDMINGGREDYAMNALSHWNGIGSESVLPYSNAAAVQNGATYPASLAAEREYVLKGYYAINNVADRDALKEAIQAYGAATVSYYHDWDCEYEGEDVNGDYTFNYFSGDKHAGSTNHAVSIVGWDDNYAKENFKGELQPETDGAWLIRNSWGADWGMNGYFWISYEDRSLEDTSFIALMDKAGNYDNNYFFDGGSIYYPSAKVLGAVNKFTAKGNELLKAVSVVFPEDANVNYTVDIYVNPGENASFASWQPVASAHTEGTTTFAGMYTVELANPVALSAGDVFAVAVRADKAVVISYDKALDHENVWFVNNVTWEDDSSYFIGGNGGLSSMEERGVARIKAYTENIDADTVTISANDLQLCVGNAIPAADYLTFAPDTAELTYTVSDTTVASVDENGTVTALAPGEATLEVRCAAANTRATAPITVGEHELEEVEAKAATCTEAGNTAYSRCVKCNNAFVDGALVEDLSALTIPANGHSLEKVEAAAATDYEDGHTEYWVCGVCGKYFADENGENEISLADTVVSAEYTRTKVERKENTCTADGNIEYYIVNDKATGAFVKYVDAENNELAAADLVIPAGHTLTKTEAVAASCMGEGTRGNIEYYTCSVCSKYFTDANGENEISYSQTIAYPKHEMTKTAAKAPTCTEAGNIQYFTCGVCHRIYKYQTGSTELTEADLVIPAKGHNMRTITANAPSCTVDGNVAYYACKACGKLFSDEEGTQEITAADTVDPATGHSYGEGEVLAEPTCVLPGLKQYTCQNGCGEFYTEIIPATGHTYDENGVCTGCGKTQEEIEQSEIQELGGEICEYCGRRHGTSWFAKFLYAMHGVCKFFKDLFAKIG